MLICSRRHISVTCARTSAIAVSLSAGIGVLAEIDWAMCERSKPAMSRRFRARMRTVEGAGIGQDRRPHLLRRRRELGQRDEQVLHRVGVTAGLGLLHGLVGPLAV